MTPKKKDDDLFTLDSLLDETKLPEIDGDPLIDSEVDGQIKNYKNAQQRAQDILNKAGQKPTYRTGQKPSAADLLKKFGIKSQPSGRSSIFDDPAYGTSQPAKQEPSILDDDFDPGYETPRSPRKTRDPFADAFSSSRSGFGESDETRLIAEIKREIGYKGECCDIIVAQKLASRLYGKR